MHLFNSVVCETGSTRRELSAKVHVEISNTFESQSADEFRYLVSLRSSLISFCNGSELKSNV